MVRRDEIVFGMYRSIKSLPILISLDAHVLDVAKNYGILSENQKPSWQTAIALTDNLIKWSKEEPLKYDLALFSLGIARFLIVFQF